MPPFSDASVNSLPEVYDPKTNTWTTSRRPAHVAAVPVSCSSSPTAASSTSAPTRRRASSTPGSWTWSTVGDEPVRRHERRHVPAEQDHEVGRLGRPRLHGVARVQQPRPDRRDRHERRRRPTWRETAPMAHARSYHNLTLLPTGRCSPAAAAHGRTASTSRRPSCPPRSGTRTPRPGRRSPRCTNGRLYHSTALLLPDGRVLMAGGGALPGSIAVDQKNAEIYSPPYLFKGARPTITAAPATMHVRRDVRRDDAGRRADRARLADPLAVGDACVRHEPAVPVPQLHRRLRQGDGDCAGERESRAARRLHALHRQHERRAVGRHVRRAHGPRPTRRRRPSR